MSRNSRRNSGTTSRPAGRTSDQSVIDIHRGEALWSFATQYPSLMLTIIEGLQNGIDNEASAIFVGIDLGQRQVIIADNGIGTDRSRFETALASVGKTVKDTSKLGRFGRGLVSPLSKCRSFTFSSVPSGQRKVTQWTFRAEDIRSQHFNLSIPCQEIPKLPSFGRRYQDDLTGEFNTNYRTMVRMEGVTQDKVISLVDLDELESQVRQKLGPMMRKNGVVIRVVLIDAAKRKQVRDINPIAFTGEPLEVITYYDEVAGEVQFELHRAQKLAGKRKGEVSVMETESNYPIPMVEFDRQARNQHQDIVGPAHEALKSGYFEGHIKCKNIQLHADRNKFEYNDALHALYVIIGIWFEEHGKAQFDNEQEVSREARYQDLGLKSLERIRDLLSQQEFSRLLEGLKSVVEFGRLGDGHVKPGKGKPNGPEGDSSIRTGQGGAGTPKTPRDPSERGTRTPGTGGQKDRPGDTPTGATGPRGNRRNLVQGDSKGLWFEHAPLMGSSRLWEFDFALGILTFNTRHPLWVKLDETNGKHLKKNAAFIMHLQEWLALQVLHLLVHYGDVDEFDLHRVFVDKQIKHYVEMFILSNPQRR